MSLHTVIEHAQSVGTATPEVASSQDTLLTITEVARRLQVEFDNCASLDHTWCVGCCNSASSRETPQLSCTPANSRSIIALTRISARTWKQCIKILLLDITTMAAQNILKYFVQPSLLFLHYHFSQRDKKHMYI